MLNRGRVLFTVCALVGALLGQQPDTADWLDPPSLSDYSLIQLVGRIGGQRVQLAMIVVDKEDEATAILSRLRAGERFDELARRFSISSTGSNGGLLAEMDNGDLDPTIQQAIGGLEAGGVSTILPVPRSRIVRVPLNLLQNFDSGPLSSDWPLDLPRAGARSADVIALLGRPSSEEPDPRYPAGTKSDLTYRDRGLVVSLMRDRLYALSFFPDYSGSVLGIRYGEQMPKSVPYRLSPPERAVFADGADVELDFLDGWKARISPRTLRVTSIRYCNQRLYGRWINLSLTGSHGCS